MKCINCNHNIPAEDINARKDMVYCRNCETVFSLSKDYQGNLQNGFDITNPPRSAWISQNLYEIKLGASTLSPWALIMIPALAFWFILPPFGFLSPGDNFPPFPFSIVFMFAPSVFAVIGLLHIAGKVEVTVTKEQGRLFVGIWKIGWSKTFFWKDIDMIREIPYESGGFSFSKNSALALDGRKRITFGQFLFGQKKYFIYRALKQIIWHVRTKKSLPVYNLER